MAQAGHAQLTLGLFDNASPYTLSLGSHSADVPRDETASARGDRSASGRHLPARRRARPRAELARPSSRQHPGRPAAAGDRAGGQGGLGRGAGAPRAVHGLWRVRARQRPVPAARRGVPARLGRARPGAGAAGLAGGADGARPLDPICPLHAGVPDPRHLGGAAADGFRRRPGPRARLRHGPVPGPGSRGHRRRHAVHRHRGRADHRIDRPAPVPGRPHPPGGLHPRQPGGRLRSRHRQPALLRPDGARPRPCGTAGPGAARLVHRPQPRAAAPGRARRLRHQPLDPGQERCHRPPPPRRHGRPGSRGPAARGCLARRRRHRRRGRPAVPAQTPAG